MDSLFGLNSLCRWLGSVNCVLEPPALSAKERMGRKQIFSKSGQTNLELDNVSKAFVT